MIPSTRKLFLSETDVVTPGRGIAIEITRTYRNNANAASGIFGNNWHFTYDRGFETIADTNSDGRRELQFRTADGRLFTYLSGASTAASAYQKPPGFFETTKAVTVSGNKLFVTRDVHGLEHYYEFHTGTSTTVDDPDALPANSKGYLVRVRDRNGNTVVINRFAANHATRPMAIDTIVDDLDRTTTFTYSTTSGQENLCVKVEQFSGLGSPRSWLYTYDGNDSLIKVETPPTDYKAENGLIQLGSRKQQEYTYSTLGSTYLLTSLEDGRGNVTFRAFYDSVGDVLQVDYGAGVDVGTAVYSYRLNTGLGMNRATQVDRNGNVLEITHEDFTISNTWLIASAAVYTRGLHPLLPSGEAPGYEWLWTHNDDSLIVECISPRDTVERLIRCTTCGCPLQCIKKAASATTLASNPSASVEDDIVTVIAYESSFHGPKWVIEPRGNNAAFVGTSASIVASVENVASQTARTFTNIDAVKRNAYTTFFYYDHENIGNRLSADTTAIGDTVTLSRALPKTYGRTASGTYRDPPDSVIFADNDSDGFPDRGGNLHAVRGPRPRVLDSSTGAFAVNRQVIEQNLTYNQYGQLVLSIEPDGDRSRLEWYVGSFNLSSNPNRGFLKKAVVATEYTDADFNLSDGTPNAGPSGTGFELTTSLTYDVYGNPLTVTNPRGFTTTNVVNAQNLVTKTTAPSPFSYEREFVFDANNNLVERRIQNVEPTDTNADGIQDSGEQQEVAAHADFVHTYAFNSANRLIRQDLDAYGSSPSTITTVYEYDARQLLTRIREHEGNVHARRYDERNLLYEEVLGASDSLTSKTTRYDYDANGNLLQVVDDDGNTNPQVKIEYDAFDRPAAWQDELGNRVEVTYDVAGLVRQTIAKGQARGDPGDPFTTYLSNSLTEYDEAGRAFQDSQELFNAVETLAAQSLSRFTAPVDLSSKRVASGELVTGARSFGQDGLVFASFDDNAHRTDFEFDAANRLVGIKDALGSRRDFVFDKNSNVIRTIETDKSSDGLSLDLFYSETFYDELDRTIATVSHLGNTRRFLYDSRGNVVQVADAMAGTGVTEIDDLRTAGEHGTFPQFTANDPVAVTLINARGNTTRMAYDGLSRLLSTTRDLRSDGTGGSSVTSTIVTQQAWDGNSRVSSRTDPGGNVTSYVYDHQNRQVGEIYADETLSHTVYNRTGTVNTVRDPRGVVKQFAYDALERAVSSTFSNLPAGQGQTTFQAWRWDGLSRQTRAEDEDTIVESYFDSFSRLTQDKQRIATGAQRASSAQSLNGEVQGTFKRVFDGVGNVVKQIYPSTAAFKRTYDAVDRLATVTEGSTTLVSYAHWGMDNRRLSRTYPVPSIKQSLTFDADRRVVRLDAVRTTDNQRIRGFAYAWDRENNRRFERRLSVNTNTSETAGVGEFYRYDSAYRLVHDDRDVATGSLDLVANNAATVTSPTIDVSKATDYMLDAAGNRRQTTVDATTSVYQLSSDSQTRDAAMNQYTRIGNAYLTHDAAGNTLSSSELGLQRFFDGENQLVQWVQAGKDIRYRYDATGRRVLKQDANSSFATVLYFYDGWHDAEEATTGGVVTKRYVYGENVDEPIRVTLADFADSDNDSNTSETVDLYYHQNSLGSVVALTTVTGSLVESYRYSSYGTPTILNKNGIEVSTTQVQQPFMFTGRRWDFEEGSNLYYYRLRYYEPASGRFVSRDPLGIWGDEAQRGNGQSYCGNNPVNWTDPSGLALGPIPRDPEPVDPGKEASWDERAEYWRKWIAWKLRRTFERKPGDPLIGVVFICPLAGGEKAAEALGGETVAAAATEVAAAATEAVASSPALVRATSILAAAIALSLEGSPPGSAPDPRDPRYPQRRNFAHGTSLEYATNISTSGLSEERARAASRGGSANRPGSFHTYELGPPSNPGTGLQYAYEWGLRYDPMPVVLIMSIPVPIYNALQLAGMITIEPTPGAETYPDVPPQVVFHPGSYVILNATATWQIVDRHAADR